MCGIAGAGSLYLVAAATIRWSSRWIDWLMPPVVTGALVALHAKGFLKVLPILIGVIAGYALAAALGVLDPASLARIRNAAWIGLPHFETPVFSAHALIVIAPMFLVPVAENKDHIAATAVYEHHHTGKRRARPNSPGDKTRKFRSHLKRKWGRICA